MVMRWRGRGRLTAAFAVEDDFILLEDVVGSPDGGVEIALGHEGGSTGDSGQAEKDELGGNHPQRLQRGKYRERLLRCWEEMLVEERELLCSQEKLSPLYLNIPNRRPNSSRYLVLSVPSITL